MITAASGSDSNGEDNEPIPPLTDRQKRLRHLYFAAMHHEENGEMEKALELLKEIYSIDYTYKDVAERVESSYE